MRVTDFGRVEAAHPRGGKGPKLKDEAVEIMRPRVPGRPRRSSMRIEYRWRKRPSSRVELLTSARRRRARRTALGRSQVLHNVHARGSGAPPQLACASLGEA